MFAGINREGYMSWARSRLAVRWLARRRPKGRRNRGCRPWGAEIQGARNQPYEARWLASPFRAFSHASDECDKRTAVSANSWIQDRRGVTRGVSAARAAVFLSLRRARTAKRCAQSKELYFAGRSHGATSSKRQFRREPQLCGCIVFRAFWASSDGYNVAFLLTPPSLCQITSAL